MPAPNPYLRTGSGPLPHVEMPTLAIPPRCHQLCVWVTVKAATGTSGPVSRLKHASGMCPHHRQAPS